MGSSAVALNGEGGGMFGNPVDLVATRPVKGFTAGDKKHQRDGKVWSASMCGANPV